MQGISSRTVAFLQKWAYGSEYRYQIFGNLPSNDLSQCNWFWWPIEGAFTPNVKSVLSENLGGIAGGTQF